SMETPIDLCSSMWTPKPSTITSASLSSFLPMVASILFFTRSLRSSFMAFNATYAAMSSGSGHPQLQPHSQEPQEPHPHDPPHEPQPHEDSCPHVPPSHSSPIFSNLLDCP